MSMIPLAILQRLYVKNSFQTSPAGFEFRLVNELTPLAIQGLSLEVAQTPLPAEAVTLQIATANEINAAAVGTERPLFLAAGSILRVRAAVGSATAEQVRLHLHTHPLGDFSLGLDAMPTPPKNAPNQTFKKTLQQTARSRLITFLRGGRLRTVLRLYAQETIGEVSPLLFGQALSPRENGMLGSLWAQHDWALNANTLRVIQALKPTLLRLPASLHPIRLETPLRPDQAAFLDHFVQVCERLNAAPMVSLDPTGCTPQQAADWVAYCNQSEHPLRKANGRNAPYAIRYWSLGGDTPFQTTESGLNAFQYADLIRPLAEAMHAVDSTLRISVRGKPVFDAQSDEESTRWNEVVLRQAGDVFQILALQLFQPGFQAWEQSLSAQEDAYNQAAAPYAAEQALRNTAELLQRYAPGKGIQLGIDAWNYWPAPLENAASLHQNVPNLQSALYTAGMLNAFIRQSKHLAVASQAYLINDLGLIQSDSQQAYATPNAYPFQMLQQMEVIALKTEVETPGYANDAYGNLPAFEKVPYVDVAATRSRSGRRLVLSIINRHPTARSDLSVRLFDFGALVLRKAWLLKGADLQDANSFAHPENVKIKEVDLRSIGSRARFTLDLPPHSVSVITLEE